MLSNSIDYNDVTHKDYTLNLSGENERSSFRTILRHVGDTLRHITRYVTGASRVDLTSPTKYKNIWKLSERMRGETMDAGITTEEILDKLQNDERLGYKNNIIFLIIFACGAWDYTVTGEETRVVKGLESTNFGLGRYEGEAEPSAPFSLTPGISSRIGLAPTSTTIFSEVHRDPFRDLSTVGEEGT